MLAWPAPGLEGDGADELGYVLEVIAGDARRRLVTGLKIANDDAYDHGRLGGFATILEGRAMRLLHDVGLHEGANAMQKDLRRLTSRSATARRHGRARRRATPMFVTPALETEDLEKARTHLAADRAEAADDPAVVASEALFASVFPPPHPYGVPVSGGLLATSSTNGGLRAFRDESLSAEHVSVACVGDFKPAWLLAALEKTLGKLPNHALGTAPSLPTLVKTGRKGLGASYGVRMSAAPLRSGGIVRITAAVDTAKAAAAVRGLLGDVERLRTEPLTDAELAAAKSRTMLVFDGEASRGRWRARSRRAILPRTSSRTMRGSTC